MRRWPRREGSPAYGALAWLRLAGSMRSWRAARGIVPAGARARALADLAPRLVEEAAHEVAGDGSGAPRPAAALAAPSPVWRRWAS